MHEIMTDATGLPLALFARGAGRTQSIWHQAITGSPVLDQHELDPVEVPGRLVPEIYLLNPLDPETLDPCKGLSIIKARGFPGRLGSAGGAKRTSWTPCQPVKALESIATLRAAGARIEGVFWLNPGRMVIEGALPSDASLWGRDAHDARFAAILDFTGGGTDKLAVSMTRTVCANTEAVALYSAKSGGSLFKIRHSANIETRYEVDVPAFLADYSAKIRDHATTKRALAEAKLIPDATASVVDRIKAADAVFEAMLGGPLDLDAARKVNTRRIREMNALRQAYMVERQNAVTTGLDPDSVRIAYEAYTNVTSHGGTFTEKKAGQDVDQWRPFLNSARSDTGRAMALVDGSATGGALKAALAFAGI